MQRFVKDALISAGAVMFLLVALVSVNSRVREYVVSAARSATPGNAAETGARLGDLGSTILTAARNQSLAHAPLAIFAIVGAILLLLMVRTP